MKKVLLIFIAALLAYFTGWWAIGVVSRILDGGREKRKEVSPEIKAPENISGRFVLKNSECAGFEFLGNNLLLWRNEDICLHPDTLKITWIDDSTFVTRTKTRNDEICPPAVNVYKIIQFNGNILKVNDYWTGYGDYPTGTMEFTKSSN